MPVSAPSLQLLLSCLHVHRLWHRSQRTRPSGCLASLETWHCQCLSGYGQPHPSPRVPANQHCLLVACWTLEEGAAFTTHTLQVLECLPKAKGVLVTAGGEGSSYAFKGAGGKVDLRGRVPVLKVQLQHAPGVHAAITISGLHPGRQWQQRTLSCVLSCRSMSWTPRAPVTASWAASCTTL